MKIKSFKMIFISATLFLMFAFSNLTQAADLVSCGKSNSEADRCTLCHLFIGIRDIIDWGKNILVVAAIVAIVAGAIMYIVSAGDGKMMESAKGIIKQAIWGVVIVLGAWVIINTTLFLITSKLYDTGGAPGSEIFMGIANWSTFSCDTTVTSSTDSSCAYTYSEWGECTLDTSGVMVQVRTVTNMPVGCSGDPVIVRNCGSTTNCISYVVKWSPDPCVTGSTQTSTAVGSPTGCTIDSAIFVSSTRECVATSTTLPTTGSATEDSVRAALLASGITINRPNVCTDADHTGCTDVAGLKSTTIAGITDFKTSCGSSCDVVITGGSEGYGIHSETGVYNHINGYKVDIGLTPEINNYITNNYTKISEVRSDGAVGYRDSSGNTYYKEGDHWDVTYKGAGS